ncbi:MAG: nicotinate phosphoribosyltransferase, partial [Clostridia bacterium]|nr:nicotinate phosphoribosyltransferase [Clostridia bacterium]
MDIIKNDNNTMLADFYQLTMAHGYWQNRMAYKTSVFDMFFRRVPDGGGFSIMAGVEQLVEYLKNLKFTDNDIEYLRSKKCFSEKFLAYLRDFKFECDVWAIREGT